MSPSRVSLSQPAAVSYAMHGISRRAEGSVDSVDSGMGASAFSTAASQSTDLSTVSDGVAMPVSLGPDGPQAGADAGAPVSEYLRREALGGIDISALALNILAAVDARDGRVPTAYQAFLEHVAPPLEHINKSIVDDVLQVYEDALVQMGPQEIRRILDSARAEAKRQPALACVLALEDELVAQQRNASPLTALDAQAQSATLLAVFRKAMARAAQALPTATGSAKLLGRDILSNGLPAVFENLVGVCVRTAQRQGTLAQPASAALSMLPAIVVALWLARDAHAHYAATGQRADASQFIRALFTCTVLSVPLALGIMGGSPAMARAAPALLGVVTFASGRTLIDGLIPAGVKSRATSGGLLLQVGLFAALQVAVSRSNFEAAQALSPEGPADPSPETWGARFAEEFLAGGRMLLIGGALKIGLASMSNFGNPVLNAIVDTRAQPSATADIDGIDLPMTRFELDHPWRHWAADRLRAIKGAMPIVTATFLALGGVAFLVGEFSGKRQTTPEHNEMVKEMSLALSVFMFKPLADHLARALAQRPHPNEPSVRGTSFSTVTADDLHCAEIRSSNVNDIPVNAILV